MTRIHFKNHGYGKATALIEDFISHQKGWQVVCEAALILNSDTGCLIDVIHTRLPYRRKGYATKLVRHLQKQFKSVAPIGIRPTGQAFWTALGMSDAAS